MSMKICFLIYRRTAPAESGNALILANAALELGHKISLAFVDSLTWHNGTMQADMARLDIPLSAALEWSDLPFAHGKISGFDAVWVLSLGRREHFLDLIQLLKLLEGQTRVLNTPEALLFMHSKLSLSAYRGKLRYPETHISCDAGLLWRIAQAGGEWMIKPPAESFGRDVFFLRPGDSNARPLLQSMTGHEGKNYCLLQRYVPEAAKGEKRVLLAGGEVIGQYQRQAAGDHRANLHQGAKPSLCALSDEEREGCREVAQYLFEKGAFFAGLDIAWPYLLEWNVISPGGLGTLAALGGGDIAPLTVKKALLAVGPK